MVINVRGDFLSRDHNIDERIIKALVTFKIGCDEVWRNTNPPKNEDDQLFATILKEMNWKETSDPKKEALFQIVKQLFSEPLQGLF